MARFARCWQRPATLDASATGGMRSADRFVGDPPPSRLPAELRVKETDRIATVVDGLASRAGVAVDGMEAAAVSYLGCEGDLAARLRCRSRRV